MTSKVRTDQLRAPREVPVGLALATLCGCMWFLSCTPFDYSALSWIAMVPALFAVERASTRLRAALFCWWAGAVMVGGGFYWLIELLRRFAGLPWPAAFLVYALFSAYQGSVFLLFGWLVGAIRRWRALPMALLAPLAMATCELAVPLLFPSHLAIMQAWHPTVIQIADLAGPIGVTALLLMVNGAIYDLLTRRQKALAPAFAAVLVLAASLAYGHFRIRHFDAASQMATQLEVGVVQPNVPYNEKGLEHPEWASQQLAVLQEKSRELQNAGAQLIVWPESSYPYELPRDFSRDFSESDPRQVKRGFTTPLVVGALTSSEQDQALFNSALLIDRDGHLAGRYDKMRLLAFGEYIPPAADFPWIRDLIPPGFGDFTPGGEVTTLPLTTSDGRVWKVGAVICYEDILPKLLRRIGAQHPNLLVNLTNDTWFGEKAEPWQHLALAVFASVEQRVGMVRAVNSGVSAFIDPNGRVIEKTYAVDPHFHPHAATASLATVPLLEAGHTVFAKVGNLFAYICAFCTLFLLLVSEYGRGAARPPS